MSDRLEKLFRTALEDMTVSPPANMWERIDARLISRQRRRRHLLMYGGVAAAVILLLASVVFLQNGTAPRVLSTPMTLVSAGPELPAVKTLDVINSAVYIPRVSPTTANRDFGAIRPVEINPSHLSEGITQHSFSEPEIDLSVVQPLSIPLTSGEAYRNIRDYNKLLYGDQVDQKPARERKESREVIMTVSQEQEKRNTPRSYTVTGYIAPGYASGNHGSSGQNYTSISYDEEQLSGIFSLNGGVSIAMNASKRFSIETGIGFSRHGQKTSNVNVSTQATSAEYMINTKVLTPLGSIKSLSKTIVTLAEKGEKLDDIRNTPSGTMGQEFGSLEIPLKMRYYFNDDRMRFSILGGLGANILLDNKSYLTYGGRTEKMEKTEDIRDFNVSTHLGVGIEYPITNAVHFKFEPTFKYYLQSISHKDYVQFKPYSFNISTGIGIRF